VKGAAIAVVAAVVLATAVTACGKKGTHLPAGDQGVFDNATPEIKELWTQALEADRTNDYYRAQVLLFEIVQRKPSDQQVEAAKAQMTLGLQKMREGVAKGDPAAKAAFDEFRQNPPARTPGGSQ
jgi:hypothetical protein